VVSLVCEGGGGGGKDLKTKIVTDLCDNRKVTVNVMCKTAKGVGEVTVLFSCTIS